MMCEAAKRPAYVHPSVVNATSSILVPSHLAGLLCVSHRREGCVYWLLLDTRLKNPIEEESKQRCQCHTDNPLLFRLAAHIRF